ncbi:MAG: putative DNA-binding transcriptional regulator [Porphyromonadaceae bacterium]|nr:putative DNA-binding transcriptional regulator [Porphyromonadaceae bacterium]
MAEDKTTRARKKEWAKSLYTRDNMTLIEIAEQVGVDRRTVARWVKEEGWDNLRTGLLMTKEAQIRNLYEGINQLNEQRIARPIGQQGWTPAESSSIAQISKTLERLETSSGIAEIISVFTGLVTWLRDRDLTKAKEITLILDEYIKHKSI